LVYTINLDDLTPGPLDYVPLNGKPNLPKGAAFTIGKRSKTIFDSFSTEIIILDDKIPSPNSYYPKLMSDGKAVSLKGFHKEAKIPITPGPANYIIPSNISQGPKCPIIGRTFPSEGIFSLIQMLILRVQLHTTQALNYSLIQYQNIPWESAMSRKLQLRLYLAQVHTILKLLHRDETLHSRAEGATRLVNPEIYPDKTPGPADYGLITEFRKLKVNDIISSDKKRIESGRLKISSEKSPGPADYSVSTTILKRGPSYSLRKRLQEEKRMAILILDDNTPGPNAYNAVEGKPQAKITMKSRQSPFVLVFPTTRIDTIRLNC
jgi:hypothetical protein